MILRHEQGLKWPYHISLRVLGNGMLKLEDYQTTTAQLAERTRRANDRKHHRVLPILILTPESVPAPIPKNTRSKSITLAGKAPQASMISRQ